MTDHHCTCTPRPNPAARSGALAVLALSLALSAPGAAQERIEGNAGGMRYALTLPEGWESRAGSSYFTRADGGRVVQMHYVVENALGPQWFRGTITHHDATLGGLAAQVFGGQANMAHLPIFPERVPLTGTRQIHVFDACREPENPDNPLGYGISLISAESFADPFEDPHFAAVLDSLSVTLPDEAGACPPGMVAGLNAVPAPRPSDDGIAFDRMGLTVWLPAEFGEPSFEFAAEVVWFDAAMQRDEPGIAAIIGLAPTREDVLDDLQNDGEITAQRSVRFGTGEFDRIAFSLPGEGMGGEMFLSQAPAHEDRFVVLLIGTPLDNLSAARGDIAAIADRIEALNSGN